MAEAEALKQARALAERNVTCAACKWLASVKLGADTDTFSSQAKALEIVYDKFHLSHL